MRVTTSKKNPNLGVQPTPDTTIKSMIHNVFIVDASGSMGGSKYDNAIIGLNTLVNGIREDNDSLNTLTIVEFEGRRISTRINTTSTIPTFYKGMGTGGMTPLNQAIGETLNLINETRKSKYNSEDKVLVNIFTDGGENSSTGTYQNSDVLSKLIKKLEGEGFTITFIGTDTEVNYAIQTLSMDASNTRVHDNTAADISRSFNATLNARTAYSKSVSRGEDVSKNFYTKTID